MKIYSVTLNSANLLNLGLISLWEISIKQNDGLSYIKQTRYPQLRLAFFTWHNRVEAQHAGHTLEELEAVYFSSQFNRTKFFRGGREILKAIAVFWNGLNSDRLTNIYL